MSAEVLKDETGDVIPNGRLTGQAHVVNAASVTNSAATQVTIDPDTKYIIVTVQTNPCFLSYGGTVTVSEFDEHLLDEREHVISVDFGEELGHISLLGDGGTAVVRIVQKA
jgi:hypothetical protein